MRSIFAAIIALSASTVVVHAAEVQKHARIQPGYMQAPVGHRQPAQGDVTGANRVPFKKKNVEKHNERFDLPPSQEKGRSAGGLESEENLLAKTIEQENVWLDREIRGICRGC
jgi:hypothetical protein